MNVLTRLPQFLDVVGKHWETTDSLFVSTWAMFRLSKKLKALKPLLRTLGKEKLGDLPRRTKEAYETLCDQQAETLQNPSQTAIEEETKAYACWQRLSDLEEIYLKQKAKLHWLAVGDRNNSYFHKTCKTRRMRNSIREIVNSNGETLKNGEEIKHEAEVFFKTFLTHKHADYRRISVEELRVVLDFRCSETDQDQLTKEVTEEEIKNVIFSMPNDKSFQADGFTSEFFKGAWSIVGSDTTVAIQSCFF